MKYPDGKVFEGWFCDGEISTNGKFLNNPHQTKNKIVPKNYPVWNLFIVDGNLEKIKNVKWSMFNFRFNSTQKKEESKIDYVELTKRNKEIHIQINLHKMDFERVLLILYNNLRNKTQNQIYDIILENLDTFKRLIHLKEVLF